MRCRELRRGYLRRLRKNGSEPHVDCGGPCPLACADGAGCAADTDCQSVVCRGPAGGKTCRVPTCTDFATNGAETGPDCGGPTCGGGFPFQPCLVNRDCRGGLCDETTKRCLPSCSDGFLSGAEPDVDCGGSCPDKCRPASDCLGPGDCTTAQCSFSGHGDHCQPVSTCFNGVKDVAETDIDCGGPFCNPCPSGKQCVVALDCLDRTCDAPGLCR